MGWAGRIQKRAFMHWTNIHPAQHHWTEPTASTRPHHYLHHFKKASDSVHRPSLWKILTYYDIPDRFINIFKALYDNSSCCQDSKWVHRVLWDRLRGLTRLHLFTITFHHSHRLRHAQNYGQVGIRHRLAEVEPLNGFGLRWWHSDSGGRRERMPRDDYQARRTKCTSWTEYKPWTKQRPWESPSAHRYGQQPLHKGT